MGQKKKHGKHAIRTSITAYRFGSMKAGETQQKKKGTLRTPSKLPTSLDELQQAIPTEEPDAVSPAQRLARR